MDYSDETWYVGSSGLKYYPCLLLSMCMLSTSVAYLFWLANNKNANIQSSIWATVTKLGMWVLVGTSNTHWVSHHWMHIMNISLHICPDWLITKKGKYPVDCMSYSDETWYAASSDLKCYPCAKYYPCALVLIHILDTSFAYLSTSFAYSDWLLTTKVLVLPCSHVVCLDLEHIFSEKLTGSGMTNTLILVGIPKSSTEGVWTSNWIAQFAKITITPPQKKNSKISHIWRRTNPKIWVVVSELTPLTPSKKNLDT